MAVLIRALPTSCSTKCAPTGGAPSWSAPLGWCGMWVGWLWSLLLVPLSGWACVRDARQSQPLLLLYAAPAIVMLGLHAAVANQSTRYNLILIGPFSVGAAWISSATLRNARWRSRALAPGP